MLSTALILLMIVAEYFLIKWLLQACRELHRSSADDLLINLGDARLALTAPFPRARGRLSATRTHCGKLYEKSGWIAGNRKSTSFERLVER